MFGFYIQTLDRIVSEYVASGFDGCDRSMIRKDFVSDGTVILIFVVLEEVELDQTLRFELFTCYRVRTVLFDVRNNVHQVENDAFWCAYGMLKWLQ